MKKYLTILALTVAFVLPFVSHAQTLPTAIKVVTPVIGQNIKAGDTVTVNWVPPAMATAGTRAKITLESSFTLPITSLTSSACTSHVSVEGWIRISVYNCGGSSVTSQKQTVDLVTLTCDVTSTLCPLLSAGSFQFVMPSTSDIVTGDYKIKVESLAPDASGASYSGESPVFKITSISATLSASLLANGSASSVTVPYGSSANLSWSSANTWGCSVTYPSQNTDNTVSSVTLGVGGSGTQTTAPLTSATYVPALSCQDNQGHTAKSSVIINVTQPTLILSKSTTPLACTALSNDIVVGAVNSDVSLVQKFLAAEGYYSGAQGIVLDATTQNALKAFQKANKLTVTGALFSGDRAALRAASCSVAVPENTSSAVTANLTQGQPQDTTSTLDSISASGIVRGTIKTPGTSFIGTVTIDSDSADTFAGNGSSYSYQIPQKYFDGQPHTITIKHLTLGFPVVTGSPKVFVLSASTLSSPSGVFLASTPLSGDTSDTVTPGTSVNMHWWEAGATSCTFSSSPSLAGWAGTVSTLTGSTQGDAPTRLASTITATTVFSLSCTNSGGKITNTNYTVYVTTPTVTTTMSQSVYTKNSPATVSWNVTNVGLLPNNNMSLSVANASGTIVYTQPATPNVTSFTIPANAITIPGVYTANVCDSNTPADCGQGTFTVFDPLSLPTQGSGGGSVAPAALVCTKLTSDLAVGSAGADVSKLQNFLSADGVFTGVSTGVFDVSTGAAVNAFRISEGLPAGLTVGSATRAAITSVSGCQTGSTGTAPSIKVTSPNGGEVWDGSIQHAITWTTNVSGTTEIYLQSPSGALCHMGTSGITSPMAAGPGVFYTIPTTQGCGSGSTFQIISGQYKIAVFVNKPGETSTIGTAHDTSDSFFTINMPANQQAGAPVVTATSSSALTVRLTGASDTQGLESLPYSGSDTISWVATNATACTLGHTPATSATAWTGSAATSGSKTTGILTTSTTLTVTCSNDAGATTVGSFIITVQPQGGSGAQTPVPGVGITGRYGTGASETIAYDSGDTLNWTSLNATSCSLSALPANSAWTGTVATTGSRLISPLTTSTVFTTQCTGTGGTGSKTFTVNVTSASTLPTVSVTMNSQGTSATIPSGAKLIVVNWVSLNATSCTLTASPADSSWTGTVSAVGAEDFVVPMATKTFTAVCTGPGGTATSQLVVQGNLTPALTNHAPVGSFDAITTGGLVEGWTVDPDVITQSTSFDVYIDGQNGSGGTLAGRYTANSPSSDIAGLYPGSHRFVWQIPTQYQDGKQHSLYIYGVDSAGGSSTLLPGSPKTFTLGTLPIKPVVTTPAIVTATPTVAVSANGSSGSLAIAYNTPATVTWSSTNATSCALSSAPSPVLVGNWGGTVGAAGTQNTGNLTTNVTLSVTCTGTGGSAVGSIAIIVASAPAVISTLTTTPQSSAPSAPTLSAGCSSGSATINVAWSDANGTASGYHVNIVPLSASQYSAITSAQSQGQTPPDYINALTGGWYVNLPAGSPLGTTLTSTTPYLNYYGETGVAFPGLAQNTSYQVGIYNATTKLHGTNTVVTTPTCSSAAVDKQSQIASIQAAIASLGAELQKMIQ